MARAFEKQQHKPGAANPYGSTERLQPLHRDQVAMRPPWQPPPERVPPVRLQDTDGAAGSLSRRACMQDIAN